VLYVSQHCYSITLLLSLCVSVAVNLASMWYILGVTCEIFYSCCIFFFTLYNVSFSDFLRGDNMIIIAYLCCWQKEGEIYVSPRTVYICVYVCMYM
jgi:hypothetical protein